MKAIRYAAIAAASLTLAFAAPVLADDPWPVESGDYVEVSMISVDDGADLQYMNHLAGLWRKGQDFAKAQGWISGYEILVNQNKRPGEPDYYLVTRFPRFADKAEETKREAAEETKRQATEVKRRAAEEAKRAAAEEAKREAAAEAKRAAAAEKELEVMRQLYEAATSPATPGSTRPTFWQWLTGRK